MPKTKSEKQKRLEEFMKQTEKTYGKKVVYTGKEAIESGMFDDPVLPTPSLELNKALHCGGFKRIVELFGTPASGKTSLAIETMALMQRNDPEAIGAWLETEHSIFPDILEQHGVDMERTIFIDQDVLGNAESSLDVLQGIANQGIPTMIVVNSIAGLAPNIEIESDLTKQNPAATARIMSRFLREFNGAAGKNKIVTVFINQVREGIGVMYGDPAKPTGGRALGFFASQRIKMNSLKIDSKDPITADEGVKVSCIVQKNRFSMNNSPYTRCEYYARYESGIDSIIPVPDQLVEAGIFTKSGSWLRYFNENQEIVNIAGVDCNFRSRGDLIETLRQNPDFYVAILGLLSGDQPDSLTSEEIDKIRDEEQNNDKIIDGVLKEMDSELIAQENTVPEDSGNN